MFFARPLLISLSIAGLFPAALALPTTNTVALDVRADTNKAPVIATAQAVIATAKAVIANATNLIDTLANLKQVNGTVAQPVIDSIKPLFMGVIFPSNGVLTGTSGDVFTAFLSAPADQQPNDINARSITNFDGVLKEITKTQAKLLDYVWDAIDDIRNGIPTRINEAFQPLLDACGCRDEFNKLLRNALDEDLWYIICIL
ncbi:hypothetical protein MSAN_01311500 [Mycena sanguinolenta]|uniref:Uncharacterized protein n=1 Tax=Mycena sanguinolenta TaxID=230812 RepID=A0A8H6YA14_9AGAR|nr:hypothetical protein MSAN_01311500 [Mycena sanguinolenta]